LKFCSNQYFPATGNHTGGVLWIFNKISRRGFPYTLPKNNCFSKKTNFSSKIRRKISNKSGNIIYSRLPKFSTFFTYVPAGFPRLTVV